MPLRDIAGACHEKYAADYILCSLVKNSVWCTWWMCASKRDLAICKQERAKISKICGWPGLPFLKTLNNYKYQDNCLSPHLQHKKSPAMPKYRVAFSKDWIKGRWGFIDRLFTRLKGTRYPSEVVTAWVVNYRGSPGPLGRVLMEELKINPQDLKNFGTIFEIRLLEDSPATKRLASKFASRKYLP